GILCAGLTASGGDWTAFRGKAGTGYSSASNLPVKWDANTNVAWKKALPGRCNGSPVIAGNLLFLTSASDDGRQRTLHCFRASDGEEVWLKTEACEQVMPTHQTNRYGGTTPAATDELVVVWHATAGLYCYRHDGTEVWHHDLGEFRHQWGYGTSPVIDDEQVILHSGPGAAVFVAAFDLRTGEQRWRFAETVQGNGERNDDGKYMGSWCTPAIVVNGAQKLAVCGMSTRVIALDTADGSLVWACDGLSGPRGDLCYTSPVISRDVCVVMGGYQGPAIGFRMQGEGNITESQRLWREERGNPQRIGSGVSIDGVIYMANAGPNLLQCLRPETGEVLWTERLNSGAHWGSLVFADGLLFTTGQDGTTIVFRPNPERFDLVSSNDLREPTNATPAVADGTIYIRTFRHLWCIRNPGARE
ncbi:MAG: PQQ-binding-like beta-propeller repeat protein, partial [Planctomycetaceae bacterium]|nr:PQQ-binding-like beta-propeller repeat protein [Planctomycetaceae bacterium]